CGFEDGVEVGVGDHRAIEGARGPAGGEDRVDRMVRLAFGHVRLLKPRRLCTHAGVSFKPNLSRPPAGSIRSGHPPPDGSRRSSGTAVVRPTVSRPSPSIRMARSTMVRRFSRLRLTRPLTTKLRVRRTISPAFSVSWLA